MAYRTPTLPPIPRGNNVQQLQGELEQLWIYLRSKEKADEVLRRQIRDMWERQQGTFTATNFDSDSEQDTTFDVDETADESELRHVVATMMFKLNMLDS